MAPKRRRLVIESPLSEKHQWTTATIKSSLFALPGRSTEVSLLFDLILPRPPFQTAYVSLRLVPLPAVSACGLPHVSSKSSYEEKEMFLAWVESGLPVTSHSTDVTDGQTM